MISFMWPALPYTKPEYKTQPLKYLVHIFGHEGPNSLLSYLMKQGLALALSTYDDHELNAISTFALDITLTKKGLENVDHVIAAVFKYAQTVRDAGVQEYIFEELHRVGELSFAFADKEDPFEYVVKVAGDMQSFDDETKLKDILKYHYVVE
jgi:insulysin